MSHLDEGRLTLLLDQELPPADRAEAERHLAGCAECRRLYDEVRELAGEADRLVRTVEPVERPPRPLPSRRSGGPSQWERWRPLAWAATLVLAVGLGWTANRLGTAPGVADESALLKVSPGESDSASPASPPQAEPVSSPAAAPSAADRRAPPRHEAAAESDSERLKLTAPENAAKANLAESADESAAGRAQGFEPQAVPAAPAAQALESRDRAVQPRGITRLLAEEEMAIAFRPATLEQAVAAQDGAVRLVDGMRPAAIRIGTGRLLPGEASSGTVVRVVYLDPPGRELWLDQQRSAPRGEAEPPALSARGDLLVGDTLAGATSRGQTRLRWVDRDGFHLVLTGWLPSDSLRALARRVR